MGRGYKVIEVNGTKRKNKARKKGQGKTKIDG
jgi:hypothetical protein